MIVLVLLVLITLFVAYANGANDNFKGVATLYGASVVDYKKALIIATMATFAGCLASVYIAEGLVKAFSGKGLVPDALTASPICRRDRGRRHSYPRNMARLSDLDHACLDRRIGWRRLHSGRR